MSVKRKRNRKRKRKVPEWEVRVGGTWYPAWRVSQKPRVGGIKATLLRYFGVIEEVRPRTR